MSDAHPLDWNIAKSEPCCNACGREFAEEEAYYSALYDTGSEFERKDFCSVCWPGQSAANRESAFSFWRTVLPKKDQPRKVFVDDAVIFDFFQRLAADENQPAKRNFRYILALMLLRKKKLKFKDVLRDNGKEYLVLRRARTQEEHRVLDPKLSEEELLQVRAELSHILETEVV